MFTGQLSVQNSPNVRYLIYPGLVPITETWQLADGTAVLLAPIRAEEAELLQDFVRTLSVESRAKRFFAALPELTPKLLERATRIDYRQHSGWLTKIVVNGAEQVIGWAEYVADAAGEQGEFALVVADAWQGRGLGRRLMDQLIAWASAAGLRVLTGSVLATNDAMLNLARTLGFTVRASAEGAAIREVSLLLNPPMYAGQQRHRLPH